MTSYYRRQVESLHELLRDGSPAERLTATDILRSLISAIVSTPAADSLEVDVQGDLAGILQIASNGKSPAAFAAGLSQVSLVAGTRFHRHLRPRLLSRGADIYNAIYALPRPGLFSALA